MLDLYNRRILEALVKGPRHLDLEHSPMKSVEASRILAQAGMLTIDQDMMLALTKKGREALGLPVEGTKFDPPSRQQGGGSNIDLPSAQDIDADLTRWSHEIDAILATSKKATDELPYVEEAYEKAWAKAYVEALAETDAVSGRENYARMKTIDQKLQVDIAKGMKSRFSVELQARQAQLSAAQSRAKLYMTQVNIDTRGIG